MIRNLKVFVLSVLALAAFGALVASAQAEPTFTNIGVEEGAQVTYKIKPDGTGKTSHIVLDISKENGTELRSLTCNELTGDATVAANERLDATFITPGLKGSCMFFAQAVTVENKGCNFTYTADGQVHIKDDLPLACEEGQAPILFKIPNCEVEIPEQTLTGFEYHNQVGGTVTVKANNVSFEYRAVGALCNFGTTKNGVITTANHILEATKKGSEEFVELQWDE